ncbi:acetolactate decarboxylase [Herbaspirillum sp. DW155]|uniref:acetolactate decarboxylase n=1 Tax=Herbaspirillum sp. DW155 TaxID=3095609 RepID=UPI00309223CB|nr:acetolactate decarboxylase [Herbaspirillum sp. DW155]
MPNLTLDIPVSLRSALERETERTGDSASSIMTAALGQYLGTPIHTLFQVSTSGALVAGVYAGMVAVETILKHGDFGLGTFAGLDGEMVVLDGVVYQVRGTGQVSAAAPSAAAPFAVVTRFSAERDLSIAAVSTFSELEARCDLERQSDNIFYALRVDGRFSRVRTRAVNPPQEGTRLVEASKQQTEFHFSDVDGTLVGIWSPGFSSAFSVPGHHFHFLSKDRRQGGHLLDCASAGPLRLRVEALTDFHLALPETESFLKADLARDSSEELAYAEKAN